jgi:hypothetical protein
VYSRVTTSWSAERVFPCKICEQSGNEDSPSTLTPYLGIFLDSLAKEYRIKCNNAGNVSNTYDHICLKSEGVIT